MLVMLVFATRAGAGIPLSDAWGAADAACESEVESPTEEIESDHDMVDGPAGCFCRGWLLCLAPTATPLPESPALTAINLSHRRPPLLRGPPV